MNNRETTMKNDEQQRKTTMTHTMKNMKNRETRMNNYEKEGKKQ